MITSILMSVALSWLLSYATDNIHDKAMQEQAVAVGEHLQPGSDGRLELDLPLDLLGLYSQAYGRYSYAVIDDRGAVLFSSREDHAALFPADPRARDGRIPAAAPRQCHGSRARASREPSAARRSGSRPAKTSPTATC